MKRLRSSLSPALVSGLMVALPALILRVDESFAQPRPPASPGAGAPSAHPAVPASAPSPGTSASAAAATPVGAVSAEVMVLHASNSGGGIDPKVRDLPQLKKPPFSSYNTYRVLSQGQISLPLGRTVDTALPNGGQFRLSFREAAPSNRFKLAATILQPNGQPFLPSLEVTLPHHEPFFIGAQSHKDGKLVLAVKLLKLGLGSRLAGCTRGDHREERSRREQPGSCQQALMTRPHVVPRRTGPCRSTGVAPGRG